MEISEKQFELDLLDRLEILGWENKKEINRDDYQEVIDFKVLKQQILKINSDIDESIVELALKEIDKINDDLLSMNSKAWEFLTEGIKVYVDNQKRTRTIKIISENSNLNMYQVVNQLEISNKKKIRKPDIILFVNGLPMVVMELKSALAGNKMENAFAQNETLKYDIPNLWKFNVMNFVSNHIETLYGSTFAPFKRMHILHDLRTRDQEDAIEFLFTPDNFYKFITTFSFFSIEGNKKIKYMAAPHQIKATKATIQRVLSTNNNMGGVVWHTQGSGKSITMLLITKELLNLKTMPKSTVVLVTDRKDLDNQLYIRFKNASDYLRIDAEHIDSRKDLILKLKNKEHSNIYFTTVQKFDEDTNVLSSREDLFVLVDEAHRTQSIDGKVIINQEKAEVETKQGYAYYMRKSFPNAKLIGFTGTPLMSQEKATIQVFGDYNHKYLMNDSVSDGTTVPIHYEMRIMNIFLNEDYLREMDIIQEKFRQDQDDEDILSQRKVDELSKSVGLKVVMEDDEVIQEKTKDILKHWDARKTVLHGKAMIVAFNREAAFKYYKTILTLRPELESELILVLSSNNQDRVEMINAMVKPGDLNKVAQEFRKDDSKYKIAIVVDMWLTGFDVQDLDTLYIDRILKWHNLMQAIARVNRTYEEPNTAKIKENGLIVDYIEIWRYLSEALVQYTISKTNSFDFEIEDIEKTKEKLNEFIILINDYYVPGIINYPDLNAGEKYTFLMQAYERLLNEKEITKEEKNKFIKRVRKINRLYKMSFASLNEKTIIIVKAIIALNDLLSNSAIIKDRKLFDAIEALKLAAKNSVETKTSNIGIVSGSFNRNINDVADLMIEEAKELESTAPNVAIQLIISAIDANLNQLETTKPIYVKKASERLRELINSLQSNDDMEHMIGLLHQLSKEITEKMSEPNQFIEPQLEAFYDILANDEELKKTKNSEVLRRIATELVEIIRKTGIDQYDNNPAIKSRIGLELRKLLKNKYNYPPDRLGGISGILIDGINEQIHLNKDYFKK